MENTYGMANQTKEHPRVEQKVFPFELKEVDLRRSEFTGYSAAIGNRDLGNDIIEPGAFRKTIRERVPARYIKFLDNHNAVSTRNVWGTVVEAAEEEVPRPRKDGPTHRLLTRFEVSPSDPDAQIALQKIAERHLDQLSIGYRAMKVEYEADDPDADEDEARMAWLFGVGARRIKEVQWWETSVVIWAMNPEARIIMNSLTRLTDFAAKARASGVAVPRDDVDAAIAALSALNGCDVTGDYGACVRKAVGEVEAAAEQLRGALAAGQEEHIRSLIDAYTATHGGATTTDRFKVWIAGNGPGSGSASVEGGDGGDDGPADVDRARIPDDHDDKGAEQPPEEAEVTDGTRKDTDGGCGCGGEKVVAGEYAPAPVAPEAAGDVEEEKQDPAPAEAAAGEQEDRDAGLADAVRGLTEAAKRLAEVAGAGDPPAAEAEAEDTDGGGDGPDAEGSKADADAEREEGTHAGGQDEGAAKDADPDEGGRSEHSTDDDDALAQEIERLEMLGLLMQMPAVPAA